MKTTILLAMPLFAASANADLFTGDFTGSLDGKTYHLSIFGFARGQYDGEYRTEGERLPLNARRFGDLIAGQIGVADSGFGFMARVQGGSLLMQAENGLVILFRRNRAQSGSD